MFIETAFQFINTILHKLEIKNPAKSYNLRGSGSAWACKKQAYNLQAVVHIIFNWMSAHAQTSYFFHFQFNVAVDNVISENATFS